MKNLGVVVLSGVALLQGVTASCCRANKCLKGMYETRRRYDAVDKQEAQNPPTELTGIPCCSCCFRGPRWARRLRSKLGCHSDTVGKVPTHL